MSIALGLPDPNRKCCRDRWKDWLILGWDIFCRVVDNYGDIGVCWRFARQLVNEHGVAVRLWVDELSAFARLCPSIDVAADRQDISGVTVCRWREPFPDVIPGDVVIEAFGCEIPAVFKNAMLEKFRAPVWINLEYLSAEPWVNGAHRLPSPLGALTKYFYFPGFVDVAGGLLRERDLIARREHFCNDTLAQAEFWRSLHIDPPCAGELRVSLFCYDNAALESLLNQWAMGSRQITCVVPEGVATEAMQKFFSAEISRAPQKFERGKLSVRTIAFLDQHAYDKLLWACDINFVRGEDSFIRAQWAARPFVWQIYPQLDDVHRVKLDAFLELYCAGLSAPIADDIIAFWHSFNGDGMALTTWEDFLSARQGIAVHTSEWSARLVRQTDLASSLVTFSRDLLK